MNRLCDFHATVIANLARHDHVGDRDSERAAASVARQCPACGPTRSATIRQAAASVYVRAAEIVAEMQAKHINPNRT